MLWKCRAPAIKSDRACGVRPPFLFRIQVARVCTLFSGAVFVGPGLAKNVCLDPRYWDILYVWELQTFQTFLYLFWPLTIFFFHFVIQAWVHKVYKRLLQLAQVLPKPRLNHRKSETSLDLRSIRPRPDLISDRNWFAWFTRILLGFPHLQTETNIVILEAADPRSQNRHSLISDQT